ncbi:MAG: adenosylcobinamide-GDP ribazoletransferase [Muribaculaceae bacterium]|nr:adenosylcobinamide-GDP ribazoletransferase [Muribaculaceae bacterium]
MRRIAAALTFFTRIPVWRWINIPESDYSSVVVYWPLIGWVTGGVTALLLWLSAYILPILPAVILALTGRTLMTGSLHEDGLADFCDGFGGGHSKERILLIMKDSHIGTFGVIGLILYYLWFISLLSSLPVVIAALGLLAADSFAKACAAQLTNLLPYARPEGAKNKITYVMMSPKQLFIVSLSGLVPLLPLAFHTPLFLLSGLFPIATTGMLILFMKKRLGGYTGDCCGAVCLICEISMLLGITIIYHYL